MTPTGRANINTQVEGGNPPDISFFPQPGKLADFAQPTMFIVPLTDGVNAAIDEYWADELPGRRTTVDGTQYGVPAKTDLKSLVWYQPARFEEAGYEIPETFDEFQRSHGRRWSLRRHTPLCVGIESGPGHRLDLHRLDRGDGASPGRSPTCTTSGSATRSRSTILRSSTSMQTVVQTLEPMTTSSPRPVRSSPPTSPTTPAARRR